MARKTVEKKTWNEFRATGLFMFINGILHAFGWAIVVETETESGNVVDCYPARVRFRGFDNNDTDEMHQKIAKYINETHSELLEDVTA